jgi:hypothetical protein
MAYGWRYFHALFFGFCRAFRLLNFQTLVGYSTEPITLLVDVRFWRKADIQLAPNNVRFWG